MLSHMGKEEYFGHKRKIFSIFKGFGDVGQCCRFDPRMSNEVREEVGYRDRYSHKSSFRKVRNNSSCKFDGIVHLSME